MPFIRCFDSSRRLEPAFQPEGLSREDPLRDTDRYPIPATLVLQSTTPIPISAQAGLATQWLRDWESFLDECLNELDYAYRKLEMNIGEPSPFFESLLDIEMPRQLQALLNTSYAVAHGRELDIETKMGLRRSAGNSLDPELRDHWILCFDNLEALEKKISLWSEIARFEEQCNKYLRYYKHVDFLCLVHDKVNRVVEELINIRKWWMESTVMEKVYRLDCFQNREDEHQVDYLSALPGVSLEEIQKHSGLPRFAAAKISIPQKANCLPNAQLKSGSRGKKMPQIRDPSVDQRIDKGEAQRRDLLNMIQKSIEDSAAQRRSSSSTIAPCNTSRNVSVAQPSPASTRSANQSANTSNTASVAQPGPASTRSATLSASSTSVTPAASTELRQIAATGVQKATSSPLGSQGSDKPEGPDEEDDVFATNAWALLNRGRLARLGVRATILERASEETQPLPSDEATPPHHLDLRYTNQKDIIEGKYDNEDNTEWIKDLLNALAPFQETIAEGIPLDTIDGPYKGAINSAFQARSSLRLRIDRLNDVCQHFQKVLNHDGNEQSIMAVSIQERDTSISCTVELNDRHKKYHGKTRGGKKDFAFYVKQSELLKTFAQELVYLNEEYLVKRKEFMEALKPALSADHEFKQGVLKRLRQEVDKEMESFEEANEALLRMRRMLQDKADVIPSTLTIREQKGKARLYESKARGECKQLLSLCEKLSIIQSKCDWGSFNIEEETTLLRELVGRIRSYHALGEDATQKLAIEIESAIDAACSRESGNIDKDGLPATLPPSDSAFLTNNEDDSFAPLPPSSPARSLDTVVHDDANAANATIAEDYGTYTTRLHLNQEEIRCLETGNEYCGNVMDFVFNQLCQSLPANIRSLFTYFPTHTWELLNNAVNHKGRVRASNLATSMRYAGTLLTRRYCLQFNCYASHWYMALILNPRAALQGREVSDTSNTVSSNMSIPDVDFSMDHTALVETLRNDCIVFYMDTMNQISRSFGAKNQFDTATRLFLSEAASRFNDGGEAPAASELKIKRHCVPLPLQIGSNTCGPNLVHCARKIVGDIDRFLSEVVPRNYNRHSFWGPHEIEGARLRFKTICLPFAAPVQGLVTPDDADERKSSDADVAFDRMRNIGEEDAGEDDLISEAGAGAESSPPHPKVRKIVRDSSQRKTDATKPMKKRSSTEAMKESQSNQSSSRKKGKSNALKNSKMMSEPKKPILPENDDELIL